MGSVVVWFWGGYLQATLAILVGFRGVVVLVVWVGLATWVGAGERGGGVCVGVESWGSLASLSLSATQQSLHHPVKGGQLCCEG